MPSLWRRISNFVSDRILQRSQETEPEEDFPFPPPPPIGGGIDFPEPPPPPESPGGYPDSDDRVPIYDDFGEYIGTHTWAEWWQETLLTSGEFHRRHGSDHFNTELIHLLEEVYGIEWDWDAYREDYEARNG